MKKLLLGTTALIGAAAIATAASAQQPLSVTVGGYVQFDAAAVSQDSDTNLRGHDFRTSTEIHVRAEGTTDNGLTYGAVVELEGDQGSTDQSYSTGDGDENHIYLSGGWGRLEFGDKKGAADTSGLALTAPGDFGLGGVVADEESYRDFIVAFGDATTIATYGWLNEMYEVMNSDTHTKITYYTPVFNGFQAGLSYTPDGAEQGQNTGRSEAGAAATGMPTIGNYEDIVEAAIVWNYAFGNNVGLGLGATYVTADYETKGLAAASHREDLSGFNLAANVTFGGFTIGGSYIDLGDSGTLESSAVYDDTDAFTLGVQYEFGPYIIGANALMADLEEDTAGNEIDYDAYSFGGTWAVAPGFVTYAEATFFDYDAENASRTDQDGSVVLVGTRIAF